MRDLRHQYTAGSTESELTITPIAPPSSALEMYSGVFAGTRTNGVTLITHMSTEHTGVRRQRTHPTLRHDAKIVAAVSRPRTECSMSTMTP